MKALPLFVNIGVAEAYLDQVDVDAVVENEFVLSHAKMYSSIHPRTNMICGDIIDPLAFSRIMCPSLDENANIVIATLPCQGISTSGEQGENDVRNMLILLAIATIHIMKPKCAFIEKVPMFYQTEIPCRDGRKLISDVMKEELLDLYNIQFKVLYTAFCVAPKCMSRRSAAFLRLSLSKLRDCAKRLRPSISRESRSFIRRRCRTALDESIRATFLM